MKAIAEAIAAAWYALPIAVRALVLIVAIGLPTIAVARAVRSYQTTAQRANRQAFIIEKRKTPRRFHILKDAGNPMLWHRAITEPFGCEYEYDDEVEVQ